MNNTTYITLIGVLILAGIYFVARNNMTPDQLVDTQEEVTLEEKYLNGTLTFEDLTWGCPRPDCIPSIDDPVFETVAEADTWMRDEDVVFGLSHQGEFRAYPQRILNWHEIVNDTVAGDPIAVTFCPLCGSAIAFDRVVDGAVVELGVSGKLYNSNLVIYDRSPEPSYWQQATGQAIVGPARDRNEEFTRVPIAPTVWADWKAEHPETLVLSRDTGFSRNYDRYPYGTYEEDGELYFGIANEDFRLPLKELTYGFDVNGVRIAYRASDLTPGTTISDVVDGRSVDIIASSDGTVVMRDIDTNEEFVPLRGMWFAWAAFHPDTLLYNDE